MKGGNSPRDSWTFVWSRIYGSCSSCNRFVKTHSSCCAYRYLIPDTHKFEVLAKLTDLWQSRIDGCPEAPILEYRMARPGNGGTDHEFRLLSGAVEVTPTDKDMTFYDKLLV